MAEKNQVVNLAKKQKQLPELVNKQVANWTVLYTKLHNYHWYVKGPEFFSLHVKLEELYNLADQYIDEIAERLLAINGKPVATLKESLQLASIDEAKGNESTEEMVQAVVDDFKTIMKEIKQLIEISDDNHDDATSDLFTGIRTELEKNIWMLEAFLGKR
ncbi:MAG: DNA starvation/stationary phase protection protein [Bacillus sp. (in: Bacteria)]|nr:DNA starvation/stationary phase protection protein [Bacillus sp. (in: firmicutes)]